MKCPKCKTEIKDKKNKCPKCGNTLSKRSERKKIKKNKVYTKTLVIIGLITIALIIIFSLILRSSLKNEKEENKNGDTPVIEGEWNKQTFSLGGETYELIGDYKNLSENGWTIKESKNLEAGKKTYTDVEIEHEKYKDSKIKIGLINNKDTAQKYEDCEFWGIEVSNDWSETPVDFSLPGGVKYGSTLKEVEEAYGKPKKENIYYSEVLKYYEYIYEIDETLLTLTIYEDKGLTEFSYRAY